MQSFQLTLDLVKAHPDLQHCRVCPLPELWLDALTATNELCWLQLMMHLPLIRCSLRALQKGLTLGISCSAGCSLPTRPAPHYLGCVQCQRRGGCPTYLRRKRKRAVLPGNLLAHLCHGAISDTHMSSSQVISQL